MTPISRMACVEPMLLQCKLGCLSGLIIQKPTAGSPQHFAHPLLTLCTHNRFAGMFSAIKSFLPPETQKKVQVGVHGGGMGGWAHMCMGVF